MRLSITGAFPRARTHAKAAISAFKACHGCR
jgi:hypothetical protein